MFACVGSNGIRWAGHFAAISAEVVGEKRVTSYAMTFDVVDVTDYIKNRPNTFSHLL